MTESVMRRIRYLVVEALYEGDSTEHDAVVAYDRRLQEAAVEEPDLLGPGPSGFGRGAVRGVLRRETEIDAEIRDAATQYPLSTMAVVDRNILRLAIWELLTDDSAYGGDSSPRFINGVLRTVSERIRSGRTATGAASAELPPQPTTQEN
jgi:transcription antitermination protein NusB